MVGIKKRPPFHHTPIYIGIWWIHVLCCNFQKQIWHCTLGVAYGQDHQTASIFKEDRATLMLRQAQAKGSFIQVDQNANTIWNGWLSHLIIWQWRYRWIYFSSTIILLWWSWYVSSFTWWSNSHVHCWWMSKQTWSKIHHIHQW